MNVTGRVRHRTISWKSTSTHLAAVLCLAAAVQVQTGVFRQNKSATVDETFYLSCAINTAHQHQLDPALVGRGTAPLPVLVSWLPAVAGEETEPRVHRWRAAEGDPVLIRRARRLNSLLVGTALVAIVYCWLLRRRGFAAACVGGTLIAFSPSIVAHSALATTDALAAVCWLLGLWMLAWYAKSPSALRAAVTGAVVGVALSAKYSMVLLCLLFAIISAAIAIRRLSGARPVATVRVVAVDAILGIATFAYIAVVVCWGMHGLQVAQVDSLDIFGIPADHWVAFVEGVEMPTPIAGVLNQQLHNQHLRPAVLFGEVRLGGWWYYFPVVSVIKATPSELFLVALALAIALATKAHALWFGRGTESGELSRDVSQRVDWTRVLWWSSLAIGGGLLLLVRIQIGHRYVLPLIPVVLLLAVDSIARFVGGTTNRVARRCVIAGAALLLVGQLATAIASAPHYLAYISPLFGGSDRGYRLLADSNVDWGQDLPALSKTLDQLPSDRIALSYFGTALPRSYGIDAPPVDQGSADPFAGYDFVAVSASHLYGIDATSDRTDQTFRPLLDREPIARAGHSILIYDVRDP